MELDSKTKEILKKERLEQYKRQLFTLNMDNRALEAVQDKEGVKGVEQRIEALEKAYKAVEAM
jgi:hypothetical protein